MSSSEPWLTLGRGYETSLRLVEDTNRETYLARWGGQRCGFVILSLRGALSGYLQSICVTADHRGQGLGTELMAFVEERIFREFPNVFLCVSSFNPRARQLYERLGYAAIGELKDYIARGYSEILLRKTIGSAAEFQRR